MTPAIRLPALLALVPVSAFSAVPAAATVATAADGDISIVEVAGRRVAGAYHAIEASGAKTELPLRELPQAVRVMTRQSLDDLGAVRLDDALDFVGGVSRQNNFGGMWDNIAIRGIAGDANSGMALLQNGFAANRGFNAPRDTANIERIEFLKGTAAALYGASEPGGTLNIVTKRPLFRTSRSLELYAGSHDFYRAAFDATGALSASAAYRLNAAHEKRGSFRDHVASRRSLIAPAFTWKIGEATTLDYRGEALRHEAPLDRGVAAVDGRLGIIPRERFLGEPQDGDVRVDNVAHQLMLDHRLGEQWSLRAGLAYKDATLRGFSTEQQLAPSGRTLLPDARSMQRQRRYRDYASEDLSGQVELAGRLQTGALAHQLLVGVEAYRLDFYQRMLRANPSGTRRYAIDVFAPTYGQAQPTPMPSTETDEDQRNRAIYVQDAVSIGNWRVLAGLRHDRYRQEMHNLLAREVRQQEPSATSPRVGISYLANANWTWFANAGRSFRPNSGASRAGEAFAPERGRAVETGVKWESADKAQGATLSLYTISKRNVATADPNNPGYSIAAGEIRSRGLDLDYTGQLSRAWRANASLSLIDAQVERDNTLEVGARLINIPRANGSLLLVYESAASPVGRWSIGGGLTYSARRLGEARTQAQAKTPAAPFQLPSYALAKLVAHWQLSRQVRLSLDIDNLFDRSYYSNSVQSTWVTPGAARSATFGIQTTF